MKKSSRNRSCYRVFIRSMLIVVAFALTVSSTYAQKLTLNYQKTPLLTVLKEIQRQTPYTFVYNNSLIDVNKEVSIMSSDEDITVVLDRLFTPAAIYYQFLDKQISLSPKVFSSHTAGEDAGQSKPSCYGTVLDEEGNPLPGAMVAIKDNPKKYATTDTGGKFELTDVASNAVLIITFLGYESMEYVSGNKANIEIRLKPNMVNLTEVVVTGYQTLSRERSAGSFSKVDAGDIKYKSNLNLVERLDGLVPGLTVNRSGEDKYLLRGMTSINSSRAPLFIVDGMPMELSELEATVNPEDIESVSVLKDATSASIWGVRAANGVIVFTTKRGDFKERINVSYTGSFQVQGLPDFDYLNYMNAKDYVDFAVAVYDPTYDYAHLLSISGVLTPVERILYNQQIGVYSTDYANRELDLLRRSDNGQQILDHFYKWKTVQQHNLNIKGGSENAAYFFSLNYRNVQPQQKTVNEHRIIADLKNDYKITSWLKFSVGANVSYFQKTSKYTPHLEGMIPYERLVDEQGKNLSQMHVFYSDERMAFINDQLDKWGMTHYDYSLLGEIDKQKNTDHIFNARVQAGLRANLFEGLVFESNFQYQAGSGRTEQLERADSYAVWDVRTRQTPYAGPKSRIPTGAILNKTTINSYEWIARNQFNYEQTFNQIHAVNILAGTEVRKNKGDRDNRIVYGYNESSKTFARLDEQSMSAGIVGGSITNPNSKPDDRIIFSNFGTGSYGSDNRYFSLYANAAYNYDSRYGINTSIRMDQANLFGVDVRYKPIWSTGVLWNLHKEAFFPKNIFERLSVRASYGIAGNMPNASIGGPYDIMSRSGIVGFKYGQTSSTITIISPALRDLRWEKTNITNFGIDFSCLANRLSGSIDFYHKSTNDLIGDQTTDPTNGFPQIKTNIGKMKNTGIELSLNAVNISNKHFTWSTLLNFAYNHNKITDIYVNPTIGDYVARPAFVQNYPAYGLFSFRWAGLNDVGEPRIFDSKGNAVSTNITEVAALVYSGTAQPPVTGSLLNTFMYKNLTLSVQIIYNLGHKIRKDVPSYSLDDGRLAYSQTLGALPFIHPLHNDLKQAWKQPGDQTDVPRWIPQGYTRANWSYYDAADINILDGSYINVSDITLSYAIPSSITKKIGIEGCSVGLQITDLFYWAANDKGIDPRYIDPLNDYTRILKYGPEYMLKLNINF